LAASIHAINSSIVTVKDYKAFVMGEMVMVGHEKLIGEVVRIDADKASIQVFENTGGLKVHEPVMATGKPLAITLEPGLLGNIFDGVLRPLKSQSGELSIYISRGMGAADIDTEKSWPVKITAGLGAMVSEGALIGEIHENDSITYKIMIPIGISGKLTYLAGSGDYSSKDKIAIVEDVKGHTHDIYISQKWPIRQPRPVHTKETVSEPLITGQRVIDTLFPIAKGGTAAVPGGFGTGKTMTQHQLAKWSNADIIIYIGCGERGNEMTGALEEFSELIDPRSNRPLLERTVLIANTSNMPVAAREASIYAGITVAEYYRDMGYDVAIMADSTSRWAEALRELSGRLEELPAEEGFPAYLTSRLASFYERAGVVNNLNGTSGSLTIIGAVSPQGGDFSEPVTVNTKRFVRTFWALDKNLAYARHFPAINWLTSYTEYVDELAPWYAENVSANFIKNRAEIIKLLSREAELMEIVKLIGSDALPDDQKLILEISKIIRIGFARQNAYHSIDTYTTFEKQSMMMEIILELFEKSKALADKNVPLNLMLGESVYSEIITIKDRVGNDDVNIIAGFKDKISEFYNRLLAKEAL